MMIINWKKYLNIKVLIVLAGTLTSYLASFYFNGVFHESFEALIFPPLQFLFLVGIAFVFGFLNNFQKFERFFITIIIGFSTFLLAPFTGQSAAEMMDRMQESDLEKQYHVELSGKAYMISSDRFLIVTKDIGSTNNFEDYVKYKKQLIETSQIAVYEKNKGKIFEEPIPKIAERLQKTLTDDIADELLYPSIYSTPIQYFKADEGLYFQFEKNGNLSITLTEMETGKNDRWYMSVENGKLIFTDSVFHREEGKLENVSLFKAILLFIS